MTNIAMRVLQFLAAPWVKWVVSGAAAALLVTSCMIRDDQLRAEGAGQVLANSIKEGKKANAQSEKAHAAARRPGAFQRLLQDSCRDCR